MGRDRENFARASSREKDPDTHSSAAVRTEMMRLDCLGPRFLLHLLRTDPAVDKGRSGRPSRCPGNRILDP
jgi:hypothetical protein